MKQVVTIARRELKAYFVTPVAYVVIAGFMLLSGFFFFSLLKQFNASLQQAVMMSHTRPNLNEWVIGPFYLTLEVVLLFLLPLLTMRSIAEERQNGTFELLITSPVKISEIVLGKFAALGAVVVLMLGGGFIFPAALICYAQPEVLPMLVGWGGLLLFSLALTALGIGVSAFSRSQTIAGTVSVVLFLMLYMLQVLAFHLGGTGSEFLEPAVSLLQYLSPPQHTELLRKGVIDAADIVYFLSLTACGIFAANRALDAQRWR